MDKVYGIFNGCYSDWDVNGYFLDLELAEKYCATKNKNCKHDEYYVITLKNIKTNEEELRNVKLRYCHEVVFDYNRENKMRIEPDRYDYFSEDRKEVNSIRTYLNGWITFKIYSDTSDRGKVEKIASDMFNQFEYLSTELGDRELALKELCKISGYTLNLLN